MRHSAAVFADGSMENFTFAYRASEDAGIGLAEEAILDTDIDGTYFILLSIRDILVLADLLDCLIRVLILGASLGKSYVETC